MPEHVHRSKRLLTKEYRMCDAAENVQLIKLRCNLCHRNVNFLAIDLVGIVGANFPAQLSGHHTGLMLLQYADDPLIVKPGSSHER